MNDTMTGTSSPADITRPPRNESASAKALEELRVYFQGSRGKLRLVGFVCQVLIASTIPFALISLVDLGSVMLHAMLVATNSTLMGADYALRFVLTLPATNFIGYASQTFEQHTLFNATASLAMTATAEAYWTIRRARRLMPPAQAFTHH